MGYVIITGKRSIASETFRTFDQAYYEARRRFGDTIGHWLDLNLRIEQIGL